MKKVLAIGLLALGVLALAHQEASAWINHRFGVGVNWSFQSGGNSALWGGWRNGQPPGPEYFQHGGYQPQHHHHHGHGMGHGHGHSQPSWSNAMPMFEPSYAQPMPVYAGPFQYATNPDPVYYYYGR